MKTTLIIAALMLAATAGHAADTAIKGMERPAPLTYEQERQRLRKVCVRANDAAETAPVEQLKWTRDSRGVWCATIRLAGNKTASYQIAGPNSDLAKFLGGYSFWNLNMPGWGNYAVFDTKKDAVAHAQEHFEKHFKVVA